MKKIGFLYYSLFALWFFLFCLWVYASLIAYSPNSAEKAGSFFPRVQAGLRFFQNSGYETEYQTKGADFIASPNNYNASYDSVGVSLDGEPTPLYNSGSTSIQIINVSRDSH